MNPNPNTSKGISPRRLSMNIDLHKVQESAIGINDHQDTEEYDHES